MWKAFKSCHLMGTDMNRCTFLIIGASPVTKASIDNQLGVKGSLNICHIWTYNRWFTIACVFYLCLHIKSFSVFMYLHMFETVLSEDKIVAKFMVWIEKEGNKVNKRFIPECQWSFPLVICNADVLNLLLRTQFSWRLNVNENVIFCNSVFMLNLSCLVVNM
jgi:hypothetical protein